MQKTYHLELLKEREDMWNNKNQNQNGGTKKSKKPMYRGYMSFGNQ